MNRQISTRIVFFSAALLLIVGIVFFHNAGPFEFIRHGTQQVVGPLAGAGRMIGQAVAAPVETHERIIKQLQFERDLLEDENERLRSALGFRTTSGAAYTGADVLFYGRDAGFEFLIIDAGEIDGVDEGDIVLSGERLFVGTVTRADRSSALVHIASNPGQTFEVELVGRKTESSMEHSTSTGAANEAFRALANGLGARAFSIDLIPIEASIATGERVVVVQQGVGQRKWLLGEIVREIPLESTPFKEIRATLLARPETLHEVFIVSAAEEP